MRTRILHFETCDITLAFSLIPILALAASALIEQLPFLALLMGLLIGLASILQKLDGFLGTTAIPLILNFLFRCLL
ncbi:protein of unknown function [Nitrospira japonica]|uniref:Uncharacterized protein n=1 Tax=Nitrospira japonica TaxID=1325564 RepID=A0A1W1I537_9BACT|nr:protein of unknown function [Nitrospira japonica]